MSRKDNDSLEEFFRKATRQHDLEYNEADWIKLERMLDAQQPARRAGWLGTGRGPKAMTALALLAGVIAALLLLTDGPATEPVSTDGTRGADSGIATTPNAPGDERAVVPGVEKEDAARDAVRSDVVVAERPRRGMDPPSPTAPDSEPVPSATGHHATVQGLDTNGENTDHEENLSDGSGFNPAQTDHPVPPDRIDKTLRAEGQLNQAQDQPADSASAELTADAPEDPDTKKSRFDPTRGRFGISVVAAPDFSMTANGGAMGAGDAVGVFLHYQVLPRWGVTAGVLYDTKKYWGEGSEYRPPQGYWKALTNGVVPDRIDGTCAMYEVPVAVTFDIISTRRTRLFASAGVSSYFMQSEEYYYHFDVPNPGAVSGWTGKKPSTLWFGIGTLSAGFDFRASRTLSLGIEPYFKVPLEGMGWADVDLYSTGVMFAARYHFTKKANKHPPTIQGP